MFRMTLIDIILTRKKNCISNRKFVMIWKAVVDDAFKLQVRDFDLIISDLKLSEV